MVSLYFMALVVAATGQRVPEATLVDKVMAQMEISLDGKLVTFRSNAHDDLRVCVAPAGQTFGPIRCFTLADVRTGRVK